MSKKWKWPRRQFVPRRRTGKNDDVRGAVPAGVTGDRASDPAVSLAGTPVPYDWPAEDKASAARAAFDLTGVEGRQLAFGDTRDVSRGIAPETPGSPCQACQPPSGDEGCVLEVPTCVRLSRPRKIAHSSA